MKNRLKLYTYLKLRSLAYRINPYTRRYLELIDDTYLVMQVTPEHAELLNLRTNHWIKMQWEHMLGFQEDSFGEPPNGCAKGYLSHTVRLALCGDRVFYNPISEAEAQSITKQQEAQLHAQKRPIQTSFRSGFYFFRSELVLVP